MDKKGFEGEILMGFSNVFDTLNRDIFPLRSIDFKMRYQTEFSVNCAKTSHSGVSPLQYSVSKVWSMVSPELKNLDVVEMFKSLIRKTEKT